MMLRGKFEVKEECVLYDAGATLASSSGGPTATLIKGLIYGFKEAIITLKTP